MGHQEAYKLDVEYLMIATMNRKKIITNGVLLAIRVIAHGYITGRLATGSGKKRNPRTSQFIFLILPPMQ